MVARGFRLRAAVWLAAVVAFAPTQVSAHAPQAEPALLLQIDDEGIAALWTLSLRGRDVSLLRAMHDLNRDGVLVGQERSRVAAALAKKALVGVSIFWKGEAVRIASIDPRLGQSEDPGALNLVALTILRIGKDETISGVGGLSVRVDGRRGKLSVQVQTLGERALGRSSLGMLGAKGRGLRAPVVLAPGQRVDVEVVLGPKTGPGEQ